MALSAGSSGCSDKRKNEVVGTMRLEIGQKMYVARGEDADSYVTSLQDITREDLLVGIPYYLNQPLILVNGDTVLVNYVGGDGVYRFSTVCRGRLLQGVVLYLLSRPEKVERIQRRSLVRLPVAMEVRAGEKPKDGKVREYHRRHASDIGAGGMSLILDNPPEMDAEFSLEFSIPVQGRLRRIIADGRVKRVQRLDQDDPVKYAVGVKFQGLSQGEEDAIVAYIFRKMSEERRNIRG